MEPRSGASSRAARLVRKHLALALVLAGLGARPALASSITGISFDGTPPGTLANITGYNDFSFGTAEFAAGVYEVAWLGGITAWRDSTTIGAGDNVIFDPGPVASGTTVTFTMIDPWTLWATTPDLSHADSTTTQWAFVSTGNGRYLWGLEDMGMWHTDADYQDAFGTLVRIGDIPGGGGPPYNPPSGPPGDPPGGGDPPVTPVPEPGTIALLALGLGALKVGRRRIH
jgi:hypothetical protein